jgi:hypothetical protein
MGGTKYKQTYEKGKSKAVSTKSKIKKGEKLKW